MFKKDALFPPGHFYSPVTNPAELAERQEQLWPATPPKLAAIDFNENQQLEFLLNDLPSSLNQYDYPVSNIGLPEHAFFLDNGLFSGLDSLTLFTILRKLRPKRMIEVGSGFSSLLTADVNSRFLGNNLDFTCIEPYPREFLKFPIPGLTKILVSKVEDIDVSLFDKLEEGDIFFIDSSHVSKTGSDVNFLYFEVLPRLRKGVFIHIHDIFFPYDYPKQWVLEENRSWNEQYILRALLMYSDAFKVIFGAAFAYYTFPDQVRRLFNGSIIGGGSFWIRKNLNNSYKISSDQLS